MNAAARHPDPLDEALRLIREGELGPAIGALEAAEAAGERAASMVLGQGFLDGHPFAADPARAVAHLERAATTPWGPPELLLSAIHWIGHGIPSDPERAWHWLRRALEVGHGPALRSAAILRATRGDAAGARELFERAEERGDAFAAHGRALLAAAAGAADEAERAFVASALPISARRRGASDAVRWPRDGGRWSLGSTAPPWQDPPRRGSVEMLASAPRVELQPLGLSPWERDYVMTIGAPLLRPSRTLDDAGTSVFADPARTSADASLRGLFPDLVVHDVGLAMAGLAGTPLERSEPLALLRYGVGQEYRDHHDFLNPAALETARWRDQGQRVTTVIAYLDDVPVGGATVFPKLGIEVEARAGRLLRFDNVGPDGVGDLRSLHRGEPVRQGDKWIVTAWFRERPAVAHGGGQVPGRARWT